MDDPSRPNDDTRADEKRDALNAAMADILQSCDQDKLARHLGLGHASHATALIAHPQALNSLAQRLGDGCADLPLADAVAVTRAVLGEGGASA